MKELILNYLNNYKVDFQNLLESNKQSGRLFFMRPKAIFMDKYPVDFKISLAKEEVDLFLSSAPEINDLSIFHEFVEGLIELVNTNSENKIQGPNYLGWYGWESKNLSISLGVNDEVLSFEARFTFRRD